MNSLTETSMASPPRFPDPGGVPAEDTAPNNGCWFKASQPPGGLSEMAAWPGPPACP